MWRSTIGNASQAALVRSCRAQASRRGSARTRAEACSSCFYTRRAFRSDLSLWGQWCRSRRIQPVAAGSADVAAWIRALAGTQATDLKPRAMATIERYLVHVGWAYRMAGLTYPTSHPLVML